MVWVGCKRDSAGLGKVKGKTYGGVLVNSLGEAREGVGGEREGKSVGENGIEAGSVLPVPLIGGEV